MGVTNSIARNLRKPGGGISGLFVLKHTFQKKNAFLEHNAVSLCHLEPHHNVLELGFGPGIGLQDAAKVIVTGKVYGIDYSAKMVQEATRSLKTEIANGRVQIDLGDVASLPYPVETMDRIYHCNCYYFWPKPQEVAQELLRVLKPGGFMVTTINVDSVREAASWGLLPGTSWEPEPYMDVLRGAGFRLSMEDLVHEESGKRINYQAILAYKS